MPISLPDPTPHASTDEVFGTDNDLVIAGEWPAGGKARIEVKAVVGIGERTYRATLAKDTVIHLPYRTARVEALVGRTSRGLDLDITVVRRLEGRGDW